MPGEATAADPSFLRLPRDIILKCVLNFDYRTLGLASCASKEIRSLVNLVSWQPYWVTSVEERPAILITTFEDAASLHQACCGWVDSLLRQAAGKGAPHVCLLFASPGSSQNLGALVSVLRSRLPGCCTLAGMVGHGVLGRDTASSKLRELDDSELPSLAISIIRFPQGTRVHAAHMMHGKLGSVVRAGELPTPGSSSQHRTWLVFGGDPPSSVDAVLADLGRQFPGSKMIGGVAGGTTATPSLIAGLPRLWRGQPLAASISTGTLCISIDSPLVQRELLTTRGVRCFSTAHVISGVDKDVEVGDGTRVTLIRELSNRVMLRSSVVPRAWVPVGPSFTPTSALVSALHQQHGGLDPRAPLFLGVQMPGPTGDVDFGRMCLHQLHDPHNIMRASGSIPVQRPVEEGSSAAFFLPNPQLASRQLEEGLELAVEGLWPETPPSSPKATPALAPELALQRQQPKPVFGSIAFVCTGRGRKFYAERGVEPGLIQDAFPCSEMCGCFCSGEIGAVPADEGDFPDGAPAHVLGFTTVLCVFKLIPHEAPGLLGEVGPAVGTCGLADLQPGSATYWPEVPGASMPQTLRLRIATGSP